MEDDTEPAPERPASDNIGPHGGPDVQAPSAETWRKIDRVAMTLARIIGRSMERENFERRHAANDNRPEASQNTEDGADEE